MKTRKNKNIIPAKNMNHCTYDHIDNDCPYFFKRKRKTEDRMTHKFYFLGCNYKPKTRRDQYPCMPRID